MIEIKHRYTDAVIYRSETAETLREAVEEAVKAGADLTQADLTGANLSGALAERTGRLRGGRWLVYRLSHTQQPACGLYYL